MQSGIGRPAERGYESVAQQKSAQVTLAGGTRFDAKTGSGHQLALDTTDLAGGDNAGPSPMELLLVALGGCTGMDVISILRKMRQDVTGYDVKVRGTQVDAHPRVYAEIVVEHTIAGRNLDPNLVNRAVELSATRYCPVGATVGGTTPVSHVVHVVEAGD